MLADGAHAGLAAKVADCDSLLEGNVRHVCHCSFCGGAVLHKALVAVK